MTGYNIYYEKSAYIIVLIMKAVCRKCSYMIIGDDRPQLEQSFRGHSETYGHMQFDIVDYD